MPYLIQYNDLYLGQFVTMADVVEWVTNPAQAFPFAHEEDALGIVLLYCKKRVPQKGQISLLPSDFNIVWMDSINNQTTLL